MTRTSGGVPCARLIHSARRYVSAVFSNVPPISLSCSSPFRPVTVSQASHK